MTRIAMLPRLGAITVLTLIACLLVEARVRAAAPAVKSFAIPASHRSLTVPIIRFTATDDVAVTGYMITESATPPLADAGDWQVTPPKQHTFSSEGYKVLYARVRDAGGIVSAPLSASTVVGAGEEISKTAIAAGMLHVAALKSDGTVTAWGNNYEGQTTIPVGLSNVVAIAAGAYHTIALKSDGTVIAWGDNQFGQATPPAGLANVVAIAAGLFHSVALKSDGTLVAWGRNDHDQTTIPKGLTNVVAIAAGMGYTVALKSDGTVTTWGRQLSPPGDAGWADQRSGDSRRPRKDEPKFGLWKK